MCKQLNPVSFLCHLKEPGYEAICICVHHQNRLTLICIFCILALGMSSISSCETRTVVESKPRKFNLVSKVKKIGKSKEE